MLKNEFCLNVQDQSLINTKQTVKPSVVITVLIKEISSHDNSVMMVISSFSTRSNRRSTTPKPVIIFRKT